MRSLVVFLALVATACGSLLPLAQPPHHPALVLDPHGRPLDTAEVISARALHLQAKALEGHHAPLFHAAPLAHHVAAPALVSTYAAGHLFAPHSAYGYGHYLKKRSLALAHAAYIAPAAVSHQSRVDVVSSPAVVSHAVAAPVLSYATPIVAHVAPAAVSHQSRVDVHSSPALVSTYAHAPLLAAHSAYGYGLSAHGYGHSAHGFGHYLKKRSLAHIAYAAPAAVSHQSRVDVHSSPAVVAHAVAAPIISYAAPVVAHVAPAAVSHQSRVDVRTSPAVVAHSYAAAPLTHSYLHSAPLAYSSHGYSSHGYSSPLVHAW